MIVVRVYMHYELRVTRFFKRIIRVKSFKYLRDIGHILGFKGFRA